MNYKVGTTGVLRLKCNINTTVIQQKSIIPPETPAISPPLPTAVQAEALP